MDVKTIQALIFQYGEPLVTRWAINGETAYLKRKQRPSKTGVSLRAATKVLRQMSSKELDDLRIALLATKS